jgi:hypothetical protein
MSRREIRKRKSSDLMLRIAFYSEPSLDAVRQDDRRQPERIATLHLLQMVANGC